MTESPEPLVSVVIPTYNHASFLKEALGSVVNQVHQNWEAIVINNFSEDDTVGVVEAMHDRRIVLENFRNNGIIAASRNRGIALSRGKYVAFLDSDDKWYPTKLSRCVSVLEQGSDLVCHGENFVWEDGRQKRVIYGPLGSSPYRELLYRKNCLSTSAVVVKRDVVARLGGFNEDPLVVTAEDYDLWLRLASAGASIAFENLVLGEYRIHSANSTKAASRHLGAVVTVLERHFELQGRLAGWNRTRAKWRIAREYYVAARALFRSGDPKGALREMARSVAVFPFCR